MTLIPSSTQCSFSSRGAQADHQHVSLGAPCPSPSALVLAFTLAHSTFVYTYSATSRLARSARLACSSPTQHAHPIGISVCAGPLCSPPHMHIARARTALFARSRCGPPSHATAAPTLLASSMPVFTYSSTQGTLARTVRAQSPQPPSRSFALCKPVVVTAHLLAAPFSLALPIHPFVWLACNAHPSTLSPPLHPLPVAVWHVRERRTLRAAASAALMCTRSAPLARSTPPPFSPTHMHSLSSLAYLVPTPLAIAALRSARRHCRARTGVAEGHGTFTPDPPALHPT
ncbi:hypothetical protein B0H14DRAFT_3466437 [Mycena olivaceomarginata]|nr:hypothetical protein B0H14DRAFT_3466437 [Mycena olivaceomarginata]